MKESLALLKRHDFCPKIDLALGRLDFIRACKLKLQAVVKAYLDLGMPCQDPRFGAYNQPLCLAAQMQGGSEILKLLLAYGANPLQSDGNQQTALALAIQAGQREQLGLLLSYYQDNQYLSANKTSILGLILSQDELKKRQALLNVLVEKRNEKSFSLQYELEAECSSLRPILHQAYDQKTWQSLLRLGFDPVRYTDQNGNSLLAYALISQQDLGFATAKKLGSSPQIPNRYGWTASMIFQYLFKHETEHQGYDLMTYPLDYKQKNILAFFDAVQKLDLVSIKNLIDCQALSPEQRDFSGQTAAHIWITTRSAGPRLEAALMTLFDLGLSLEVCNAQGKNLMQTALEAEQFELIPSLLGRGIALNNETGTMGKSLSLLFKRPETLGLAAILMEAGAKWENDSPPSQQAWPLAEWPVFCQQRAWDLNEKNQAGQNVLLFALDQARWADDWEKIQWLNQAQTWLSLSDLNLNQVDNQACNALHYLARLDIKEEDFETYKILVLSLLNQGGDFSQINHQGLSPYFQGDSPYFEEILWDYLNAGDWSKWGPREQAEIWKIALWREEEAALEKCQALGLSGQGWGGDSPLHYAMSLKSGLSPQILNSLGWTDINKLNVSGHSPLHWALTYEQDDWLIEILVQQGANPNIADQNGLSPLHLACRQGDLGLVQLLERYGAKYEPALDSGQNAYVFLALDKPNLSLIQHLIENHNCQAQTWYWESETQSRSSLHKALATKDKVLISYLVEKAKDLNPPVAGLNSPLSTALHLKDKTLLRLMFKHGANPLYIESDGQSVLAKMLALDWHKDKTIAPFIKPHLSQHKNPNKLKKTSTKTNLNWQIQPWFWAVYQGSLNKAQQLWAANQDPNVSNILGETALMLAAAQGRLDWLRWLIQVGADGYARNHFGETALAYARAYEQTAAQALLIEAGLSEDLDLLSQEANLRLRHQSNLKIIQENNVLALENQILQGQLDLFSLGNMPPPLYLAFEAQSLDCFKLMLSQIPPPAPFDPQGQLIERILQSQNINFIQACLAHLPPNTEKQHQLLKLSHQLGLKTFQENYLKQNVLQELNPKEAFERLVEYVLSLGHQPSLEHFLKNSIFEAKYRDSSRQNLLHYLFQQNHSAGKLLELSQFFLSLGIKPQLKNRKGQTALALALQHPKCNGKILKILLQDFGPLDQKHQEQILGRNQADLSQCLQEHLKTTSPKA